jgi:DNA polymerase I-like protein with 3'-5' exonuclease and polymerase domains
MNTGQHRTITGLIFYWPGTKMDHRGQIENKRNIFNYPVSSLATADISQIGAVCSWHRMKSLGLRSFLISVVHDAEIAEVHPDEVEIMNETCRQGMLDDMLVYLKRCYNIDFDVPLEVEENIGDFWKDKKSWQEKWLQ